ncbi:cell division protein SepF [Paucilactobacillus sp. N302-9]
MAKFSLNNFFGMNEEPQDEEQYYEEPTATTSSRNQKVVSINSSRPSETSKISLFEPRIYSDVKEIATQLLNNRAIIVNFTQMDNDSAKRVVDFLNGTVYAIEGAIERVGDQIFLCTPHNYEVTGNLSTNLTQENDNL